MSRDQSWEGGSHFRTVPEFVRESWVSSWWRWWIPSNGRSAPASEELQKQAKMFVYVAPSPATEDLPATITVYYVSREVPAI